MATKGARVLIVGGGIAGLAAAKTLCEAGWTDVILLEAQDRIGGRIHTETNDGLVLEMGAQWIHGEGKNPVYRYATKNGFINPKEIESGSGCGGEGLGKYLTQDGQILNDDLVKRVSTRVESALEECEREATAIDFEGINMEDHIRKRIDRLLCEAERESESSEDLRILRGYIMGLCRWHLTFQCLDNACYSMKQVSAATWREFLYFKGEQWINLPSGYSSLIHCLVLELPKKTVLKRKEVILVEWNDGQSETASTLTENRVRNIDRRVTRTKVTCLDGASYNGDHVILTLPLGVLKKCSNYLFRPPLPASKRRIIKSMGFGTLNKIFLLFESPFWSENTKGFQFVWTDKQSEDTRESGNYIIERTSKDWFRDLTGFDVLTNQPGNVLLGWIGRHGAEIMESLSEKEVGSTCVKLLKRFTRRDDIPEPSQVIRSRWKENRYSRGSFSFRTLVSDSEGSHTMDLAEPIMSKDNVPRLLFAGEATQTNYFSTVHGAFMSGKREAERLIQIYEEI